jgi:hypothetical protein
LGFLAVSAGGSYVFPESGGEWKRELESGRGRRCYEIEEGSKVERV